MTAYYNEIDPFAAESLRNLIAVGHIMAGDVDERSTVEVSADDLEGYDRCHFFAGIAGWDSALGLAGWGDRPLAVRFQFSEDQLAAPGHRQVGEAWLRTA